MTGYNMQSTTYDMSVMNLLIHADPGARAHFLAAWLTNKLTRVSFNSGQTLFPVFTKIHRLERPSDVSEFDGVRIRIRPTLPSIDLLCLLFLRKNVHSLMPEFTRDEYSIETFTKLTHFAQEILQWDQALDYSVYDYVIDFPQTFDNEFMTEFYATVTGHKPIDWHVDVMRLNNLENQIHMDPNHACSILKLILTKEHHMGLKEEHRFWSIVNIYNNTATADLYDTVNKAIVPENYGLLK